MSYAKPNAPIQKMQSIGQTAYPKKQKTLLS